jgi:hypothetical protein
MSARTILNPPIINELNSLFDGSGTITVSTLTATDTITADGGLGVSGGLVIESGGSTISSGDLTLATGDISLDTGSITATAGDITTTDGNISCASGTMTAQKFAGGIGSYHGTISGSWTAQSTVTSSYTIPNFLGNGSSSYVISGVSNILNMTIEYTSNTSTGTTVSVSAYNISSVSFEASEPFSIIAIQ